VLNEARCRYVVVGGLAVVLYGHARLTVDIDLMIDLDLDAARKTKDVLVSLGLQPRAPVQPHEFADPTKRQSWIRDKKMRVRLEGPRILPTSKRSKLSPGARSPRDGCRQA
jgi:hypothetical protein